MWHALWVFLKLSPENIVSAKSAASEAGGHLIAPVPGRKPSSSLENQLLMTIMRLRLGRQEEDLPYQLGVGTSSVSRIPSGGR